MQMFPVISILLISVICCTYCDSVDNLNVLNGLLKLNKFFVCEPNHLLGLWNSILYKTVVVPAKIIAKVARVVSCLVITFNGQFRSISATGNTHEQSGQDNTLHRGNKTFKLKKLKKLGKMHYFWKPVSCFRNFTLALCLSHSTREKQIKAIDI
ncbi:hypothetical protein EGR_01730 [Echinococcus granulosus]|uniref:Uncharacterized protein n=1 Tax=Echinococcus granulosus TaxID=6210 RepID=W6V9F0_ECHGR|nr:hypothetical protein EGR_01730 [Echinococcus granulosus]EUB63239.1 hypothetical protein EGR_01730 [Echinococcus granulosus]